MSNRAFFVILYQLVCAQKISQVLDSAIVPMALYQVLIGPYRRYCVDNTDVFHTVYSR